MFNTSEGSDSIMEVDENRENFFGGSTDPVSLESKAKMAISNLINASDQIKKDDNKTVPLMKLTSHAQADKAIESSKVLSDPPKLTTFDGKLVKTTPISTTLPPVWQAFHVLPVPVPTSSNVHKAFDDIHGTINEHRKSLGQHCSTAHSNFLDNLEMKVSQARDSYLEHYGGFKQHSQVPTQGYFPNISPQAQNVKNYPSPDEIDPMASVSTTGLVKQIPQQHVDTYSPHPNVQGPMLAYTPSIPVYPTPHASWALPTKDAPLLFKPAFNSTGTGLDAVITPVNSRRNSRTRQTIWDHIHCQQCGTNTTPEWRRGPSELRVLCNACGLYHKKMLKKHGEAEATKLLKKRRVSKTVGL